jgi:hypothetical protein
MRYRYEIHFYSHLGEIVDDISKWYLTITQCEDMCFRRINSKKWGNEFYDTIGGTCFVEILIVSEEEDVQLYGGFTRYKILKSIKDLVFPDSFIDTTLKFETV